MGTHPHHSSLHVPFACHFHESSRRLFTEGRLCEMREHREEQEESGKGKERSMEKKCMHVLTLSVPAANPWMIGK